MLTPTATLPLFRTITGNLVLRKHLSSHFSFALSESALEFRIHWEKREEERTLTPGCVILHVINTLLRLLFVSGRKCEVFWAKNPLNNVKHEVTQVTGKGRKIARKKTKLEHCQRSLQRRRSEGETRLHRNSQRNSWWVAKRITQCTSHLLLKHCFLRRKEERICHGMDCTVGLCTTFSMLWCYLFRWFTITMVKITYSDQGWKCV